MGIKNGLRGQQAGCFSKFQVRKLEDILDACRFDPSLASDLEGCGPVAELERQFAKMCGVGYALALSSGTAALHVALLAAGIRAGDEVIVTSYSWAQSVSPVLFCGATPVFADIDPGTCNLDPVSVKSRISSRTRAILTVHLFGQPADLCELREIADQHQLTLIADGAHALGAKLDGGSLAARATATCYSLSRGKLVFAGEGGIMVTNDDALYRKAVRFSQHHERVRRIEGNGGREGFALNYRLHPLAALLALGSLAEIESRFDHRRAVREAFAAGLGKCDRLVFPQNLPGVQPAPYGIPLTYSGSDGREQLVARVRERGIPLRCGPVVEALHRRLDSHGFPGIVPHLSWKAGACPQAEDRCRNRELWVLSALDMDGVSLEQAERFGLVIRKLL
ncbi:MAG: hypothetical protein BZ151_10065 [Desulfobacca sp. 4484_104]|nr:MAG: hypothetical protein BZ151_10065 [Desulfobacca sp. 4484_104]